VKKSEEIMEQPNQFQVERVDLLLQEFAKRFPPYQEQHQLQLNQSEPVANGSGAVSQNQVAEINKSIQDQPVEKKMKMNSH
jgi:hypothetical protein